MLRQLSALILCGIVGACAAQEKPPARASNEAVMRRAAFDFTCAESSVQMQSIDDRTRVAWGCGQRATYIETCEGCMERNPYVGTYELKRCNCTWVLNGRQTMKAAPVE